MDFSVDWLHAMEDDMRLQIDKLMKALNVPSSSDISTTTLNKLNKAPIAGFLVDMVKILEQNLDLCKSAAATFDKLKSEQIELQKQLISVQSDQMAAVKQSVKAEMKSWADVARKTVSQNNAMTTKVVKEAVKAVSQEEEKSKNLIIYGVEEGEDLEADVDLNEKVMNDVVKSICGLTIDDGLAPKVKAVCRIGQFDVNKSRPIRVEFINSRTVDTILKNASRLKTKPSLKSVYVSPDRTKEQRAAHAKLVHKMKEMISRDNSKHYFIRDNEVKCVDKK